MRSKQEIVAKLRQIEEALNGVALLAQYAKLAGTGVGECPGKDDLIGAAEALRFALGMECMPESVFSNVDKLHEKTKAVFKKQGALAELCLKMTMAKIEPEYEAVMAEKPKTYTPSAN